MTECILMDEDKTGFTIEQWNTRKIPTLKESASLSALYKELTHKYIDYCELPKRFFKILREEGSILLIAYDKKNGVFAGMGLVHIWCTFGAGEKAFIDDIVVHPEYQKRGLGKKITEILIKEARARNAEEIRLTSNSRNPARKPAIALYRKIGFKKSSTTLFEYAPREKK